MKQRTFPKSARERESVRNKRDGLIPRHYRQTLGLILAALCIVAILSISMSIAADQTKPRRGVCPPFPLRDEQGNVIDPVRGINATAPYSPKQTCGADGCHDYKKITEGFHFTQGKGETVPPDMAKRFQWVSSPGNYGGNWCSPAPLYRYLAPKKNESAKTIDMTSFGFITAGCGACHPGGGPLEYDRAGKRYDHWMADPASGLKPGGDNNFDGDYYKALWSRSGVIEADCLLCHLPSYDFGKRNKQLQNLNFRWAATEAAGFGTVNGAVVKDETPQVTYDLKKFDANSMVKVQIVTQPRNETCLACHAQPGWKKRGADFRARTDVHLRAGLRCVDCHAGGSNADDPRIRGREIHQFGKGDDPGGRVRDDLDNTVRDCASCHTTGRFSAPVAVHAGLPPLHLQRIACQTCHIPEKLVMPIQVQASDVFNPDAWIDPGMKQLWTFYGVDGVYRNHYGFLKMMGYDDKPTERFRPVLARYKAKIYPVNRIHSAWPAIEIPGQPGLMQPRPPDIVAMWKAHRENPTKYPELATIKDDNGDGVVEVNRPEEIAALIAAVTQHLTSIEYDLAGKRVVWVLNDRVYSSGTEYRAMDKADWEASPYANVHKYNHDVQPARAALGAVGCTDCHHKSSPFFFAQVLKYPFDANGKPVTEAQHQVLGISRSSALISAWRETYLKPLAPWLVVATVVAILLHLTFFGIRRRAGAEATVEHPEVVRFSVAERLSHFLLMIPFIGLGLTGFCFFLGKSNPLGPWAFNLHAWLGWAFLLGVLVVFFVWARDMVLSRHDRQWLARLGGYFGGGGRLPAGKFNAGQKIFFWLTVVFGALLAATGVFMFFVRDNPQLDLAWLYTLHTLAAMLLLPAVLAHLYLAMVVNPGASGSIFGGCVSRAWAKMHHPDWDVASENRPNSQS